MSNFRYAARLMALLALALLLKGCIGTATVVGAAAGSLAVHATQRNNNMDRAEAGDAAAQAKVGTSYCCAGPGYSAQKATEWLCRSARQEYAPAFYELGRIYIGDVTRIPHPGLYITAEVTAKKNLPLSLMWLKLAADAGIKKAARKIKALEWNNRESPVLFERASDRADQLKKTWKSQPCTYDAVFA